MNQKTNTSNVFFKGERFNAQKQAERLLKGVNVSKTTTTDIVKMAFEQAYSQCESHLDRKTYQDNKNTKLEEERLIKANSKLKKKSGSKSLMATKANIRADVYRRLKKKYPPKVVDEVISEVYESIKDFALKGIVVRIEKFIELSLKQKGKPFYDINTNKFRIGVTQLHTKVNPEFKAKINELYPCQEMSKDELENPFKSK